MNAFLSFPSQLKWDALALAAAVPVRLRLHELFAFDAFRDGPLLASANGDTSARTPWRHRQYVRAAELPPRFRIS